MRIVEDQQDDLPEMVRRLRDVFETLSDDPLLVEADDDMFVMYTFSRLGRPLEVVTLSGELARRAGPFLTPALCDALAPLAVGPVPRPPAHRHTAATPDASTFYAYRYRELCRSLNHTASLLPAASRTEVHALANQLSQRWAEWFRTDGTESLRTLNLIAGSDAVVSRGGFLHVLESGDPGLPDWIIDCCFAAIVGTSVRGASRVRGEAIDEVLDTCQLHIKALGETRLRRLVEDAVDRLAARAPLALGAEPYRVVAMTGSVWEDMFWSDALTLCFPFTVISGHVLAGLPEGIARRVEASKRFLAAGVDAGQAPVEESFGTIAATFDALVGDGLDVYDALETAVAVLS